MPYSAPNHDLNTSSVLSTEYNVATQDTIGPHLPGCTVRPVQVDIVVTYRADLICRVVGFICQEL